MSDVPLIMPPLRPPGEKFAISPSPGEVITSLGTGNTYTIGGRIGEGHFGIVYACKDVWENDLAVKVLKPIGTYEKVKSAAAAEFQKLLQLRHPYITFVYDAFEYRDTFYIVTERCHSALTDLFKIRDLDGILWLVPIARCLLQAVYYLHLNNYVHQDIHSGNVFSTFVKSELIPSAPGAIRFKLGDLGVTKLVDEVDAENTRADWMLPPEVLNESEFGPIDHRVDIYHIGLLLLSLACSEDKKFSQQEILDGRPRDMALELPAPYNFALEKALRRHVADRTDNAMELWRDLHSPSQPAPPVAAT